MVIFFCSGAAQQTMKAINAGVQSKLFTLGTWNRAKIPYPFTDVRTLNSDVFELQDFRHFRVATILVLLIFSLMFCELFNKIITN